MMKSNTKKKVVIWGASGHARVVADIIRLQRNYELVGFLDDVNPDRHGTTFCSATILGGREQLDNLLRQGVKYLIFGFGNCKARLELADLVRAKGFSLATVIHPKTVVASDIIVGPGTVIVAGAVINPGVKIGENVIINTCASVDHDSIIDDGVHIAPGVNLGGSVRVGQGSWIGIGTAVSDHITIGAKSIIGAGSVVVNDIPPEVLAHGTPARVIKRLS